MSNLSFSFLNFFNYFSKFEFPFFFDHYRRDFYRYSGSAYDYIFDSSFYKAFIFFDVGLKGRFVLPFYLLFLVFPFRYQNAKFFFWREFKFLAYNSYCRKLFDENFNVSLGFFGYFPFSFYNFFYKFNFLNCTNFSFIAYDSFFKYSLLHKKWGNAPLDFDRHISFGLFNNFSYRFGFINFFRYFVPEIFVVNNLLPNVSFFVNDYDNDNNRESSRLYFFRLSTSLFFVKLRVFVLSGFFLLDFNKVFYEILLDKVFLFFYKFVLDSVCNYLIVKNCLGFFCLFSFYFKVFYLFRFFFVEQFFFNRFFVNFYLLRFFFFLLFNFKIFFGFFFFFFKLSKFNFFLNVRFVDYLVLKHRIRVNKRLRIWRLVKARKIFDLGRFFKSSNFKSISFRRRFFLYKDWSKFFNCQKFFIKVFFSNPFNTFNFENFSFRVFVSDYDYKGISCYYKSMFVRYNNCIRSFFFYLLDMIKYNFSGFFINFSFRSFYNIRFGFFKLLKVFFLRKSFIKIFHDYFIRFFRKLLFNFFYVKRRKLKFVVVGFSGFLRTGFYRIEPDLFIRNEKNIKGIFRFNTGKLSSKGKDYVVSS